CCHVVCHPGDSSSDGVQNNLKTSHQSCSLDDAVEEQLRRFGESMPCSSQAVETGSSHAAHLLLENLHDVGLRFKLSISIDELLHHVRLRLSEADAPHAQHCEALDRVIQGARKALEVHTQVATPRGSHIVGKTNGT